MATVQFTHSKVGTLQVDTGANNISWAYGLNTVTYPTYGGEVVQILSVYIEDLQVQGEVRSYRKMEEIYSWFLEYVQLATQDSYVQEPVVFTYPERGWKLEIIPMELPGLLYGVEVVVPTWSISAAVHEDDPAMREISLADAEHKQLEGITQFGRLTGEIGFIADNPFSDPRPKNRDLLHFDRDSTKETLTQISDHYVNKVIPSYLGGDFDALTSGFGSMPAFLRGQVNGEDTRKEIVKNRELKKNIK